MDIVKWKLTKLNYMSLIKFLLRKIILLFISVIIFIFSCGCEEDENEFKPEKDNFTNIIFNENFDNSGNWSLSGEALINNNLLKLNEEGEAKYLLEDILELNDLNNFKIVVDIKLIELNTAYSTSIIRFNIGNHYFVIDIITPKAEDIQFSIIYDSSNIKYFCNKDISNFSFSYSNTYNANYSINISANTFHNDGYCNLEVNSIKIFSENE